MVQTEHSYQYTVLLCALLAGVLAMVGLPALFQPSDIPDDFWGANSTVFDHPEPNYVYHVGIGEFWSCLTTIPFAGILLLATAIRHDYPLVLIGLYLHTVVMYCTAFFSHMSLNPQVFSFTVWAVVANSLYAFKCWGQLVTGGPFRGLLADHPGLHWSLTIVGLIVAFAAIMYLQIAPFMGENAGFKLLAIVQPPFVFLGLLSAFYLTKTRYPNDPGFNSLCVGSVLLMTAMGVSSVETWVEPVVVRNFPVLHVIIHILEQVGIFFYGHSEQGLLGLLKMFIMYGIYILLMSG